MTCKDDFMLDHVMLATLRAGRIVTISRHRQG
jgi:hypothetical protein